MDCDANDLRYPMLGVSDEQIAAEIVHERGMVDAGVAKAEQSVARERARGNAAMTPGGRTLLKQLSPGLADAIADEIERLSSGGVKRKPPELRTLRLLPPEDMAVLALRGVLCTMASSERDKHTLQKLSYAISHGIGHEWVARQFYKNDRPLFERTAKRAAQASSNPRDRVKKMLNAYALTENAEDFPLNHEETLRLGAFIIAVMQGLGILTEVQWKERNRVVRIYELSEEAMRVCAVVDMRAAETRPAYMPTIIPPRPWLHAKAGGYWTNMTASKLVRTRVHSNGKRDLKEADAPRMFGALNYLQNVPYRVNRKVLEVVSSMHRSGLSCDSLPSAVLEEVPAKPHDIDTNEESRKAWRLAARDVHVRNSTRRGRILASQRTLRAATEMADHPRIYFPKVVDFRGRVYDVPQFLKPQGDDLSKGLLEFGTAKPLGDEGAWWLAIHLANTWGEDKVSFDDRVRWVEANEEMILACARAPLDARSWMDADAPFQFLAACFEWEGYRRDGEGWLSRIPVALDGSCNGLQHLSALLRDPVGGAAVNLVPADKPQDIYTEVLKKAVAVLQERAAQGEPTAQKWLPLMKRNVVKRPVMTLPYGATRQGYADQIMEDTLSGLEKEGLSPFGKEGYEACRYLAAIVWDATGETVIAARQAMDWLQECAKVAASAGKNLQWRSPIGFPVVQDYRAPKGAMVELRALGQRVRFRVATGHEEKIDKAKMARSIAPNFVHALDAAHMLRTVELLADTGGSATHLTMIHDSYATHACDAASLATALRQAFVQMYQEADWLEEFRVEIAAQLGDAAEDLPPLPSAGKLDLSDVIRSSYFFA